MDWTWKLDPRPRFQNEERTSVLVNGGEITVPWNAETNTVLDVGGEAGRLWSDWKQRDLANGGDGEPFPYVAPPARPAALSEEIARCIDALHAIRFLERQSSGPASATSSEIIQSLKANQIDGSLCAGVADAIENRLRQFGGN